MRRSYGKGIYNGRYGLRKLPCYKCTECNEIIYTGDVVQEIEKIVNMAKQCLQGVSIIDYNNYKQVA